jgi:hypothetical protein
MSEKRTNPVVVQIPDDLMEKCRVWAEEMVALHLEGADRVAVLPWSRDEFEPEQLRAWLASRKAAGATIDIETCELGRWKANDFDPYGIRKLLGELPEECWQIGTNRFVRSPESRGWVCEDDLPSEKVRVMYDRIEREWQAYADAHLEDPRVRSRAVHIGRPITDEIREAHKRGSRA